MSKKIEEDSWVICPECKTKLKNENLSIHMRRVHKKKIDDEEVKNNEMSHNKGLKNKTLRFISKTTIVIAIIIIVVIVASIFIYFVPNFKDINPSIDSNGSVSINGKGNYSSIQDAIDSASDNDILFVRNGTYFENINITKSIKLIGEDKNITIINGDGSGTVINILADNVKISSLTIKNGGPASNTYDSGITIDSNYNTISDCNISSNKYYGLILQTTSQTTNNTIKNNIFTDNKYGIYTINAKWNNISSNTFTNNTEYGMYLTSRSDDNLISYNTFTENKYGIRIKGSEKNTIIKNLIMNNINGLYFCCGSVNNIVYSNIFKNSTYWNAKDEIGNTWYKGRVGNYWDDYIGTDVNGDGIGDSPYIIDGDTVDRFPLMEPK